MQPHTSLRSLPINRSPARLEAWEGLILDIARSISFPASLYARLESHYEAIGQLLSESSDPEFSELRIFPQGSISTRTLVRPLSGDDADVDAIAFRAGGTTLTPQQWLDRLHAELEARARTQGEVERKNRCVTVTYNDSVLPAHVDVTPAIPTVGNTAVDGSGPLEVPDYRTNCLHPSSPKDFADWVISTSEEFPLPLVPMTVRMAEARATADIESLPTHADLIALDPLRVAIKLAKRNRDIYARAHNCDGLKPISVVLTTLITKAYRALVIGARIVGRNFTMGQALREIVDLMPKQFDSTGPRNWRLANPRRPKENFAEKWNHDDRLADNFYSWHAQLQQALEIGLRDFSSREDLLEAIEGHFGSDSQRVTARVLNEAVRSGGELPGLAAMAAKRLRESADVHPNVSNLIGLAHSAPDRPQRPPDLGRLG